MNNSIQLRLKPKLEVILKETHFEVIDSSDPKNEGKFLYSSVESIEYQKEKINWLVSIASYIFGIFIENGLGNNYKDKAYLKINLENKILKIWLTNSEMDNVELLKTKLSNKIILQTPTSQNT